MLGQMLDDGLQNVAPALGMLRARSERQAMDWALVLASQGILATVLPPTDEQAGWQLSTEREETSRARAAVVQYRRENQGFAWRQPAPLAGLMLHRGALVWAAALLILHLTVRQQALAWLDSEAVRRGEAWRVFTAVWLHADMAHLGANLSLGTVLMALTMARYGAGFALLGTWLAGASGNLLGLTLRPGPYTGLGASGMVMGALGMLASQAVPLWRAGRRGARAAFSALAGGAALFFLTGLDPDADLLAHAGGFVAGLLAGAVCAMAPPDKTTPLNKWALAAFTAGVIVAWRPALRG